MPPSFERVAVIEGLLTAIPLFVLIIAKWNVAIKGVLSNGLNLTKSKYVIR